jgi:hypothetical protein
MSRNSKNARNLAKAKSISLMHKNGEKGPKATTPLHGKKWGYRNNPEVLKRIAEQLKATHAEEKAEKTSGKKILRKAGSASQPVTA